MKGIEIKGLAGATFEIRDYLTRNGIPFTASHELDSVAGVLVNGRDVVPTLPAVLQAIGWIRRPSLKEYDLAIIGSGPAGLSAAVYGASEGLTTCLVERNALGGQAGTSTRIENYLGFPEGISGAALAKAAREQAVRLGAEILLDREAVGIGSIYPHDTVDRRVLMFQDASTILARTVLLATGIAYQRLGLPDEDKYLNNGVYYGSSAMEIAQTGSDTAYIIGGGNSAGQAAIAAAKFAAQVVLIVRREGLSETMSAYLVDRIRSMQNVSVLAKSEVTKLHGDAHNCLTGIEVSSRGDAVLPTRHVFVCIGGNPRTEWLQGSQVKLDKRGYILAGPDAGATGFLATSMDGVFAAGDVRSGSVKRVASAVGEGAMAVTLVHQYLNKV